MYRKTVKGVGKNYYLHRLIAKTPDNMVVDHIDGDKLNNTRANLRNCTQSDNCKNVSRRKGGHSTYKGVTWFTTKRHAKGYWKAQICGRHIGYYEDEEKAAKAYDQEAIREFGEFAKLNFAKKSGA